MSNKCRLCKSKKISPVVYFQNSVPVDNFRKRSHEKINLEKYKMDLFLCKSCGHVQLINVVDPNILFGDYIYESSSSPGLKKHFKDLYKKIINDKLISKGDFILDVGCNDGLLLENFLKNNYMCFGVDPDSNSLKVAQKKGVKIYNSYLNNNIANKIIKQFGKFNLITATNVYSHSDNLIDFTKCVANMLKNNSYFVFEVSYLKALLFSGVWDYVYHEHLAYHSIKPINKLTT